MAIVSPFYLPAPGGAARYYSALAHQLLQGDTVQRVTIFTEAHPGQPKIERHDDGRVTVRRIFPFRAGNLGMSRWVLLLYLYQQLQLLTLPFRVPRRRNVVLVHGYFHNKPGLAPLMALLFRMMRGKDSRLIVDLRDPRLPGWAFPTLYPYDRVLCCSENVFELIARDPRLRRKAQVIPIPFEIDKPSDEDIASVLRRYDLRRCRYIYSANGVQQDKNVDEILEMTQTLRQRGRDLKLVVAGRRRDWMPRHDDAVNRGDLIYIGLVSHRDSLCLSAGSALVPVISPTVEGMPRSALEALALGVPVMLPSNVPEFRRCCPDQVADSIRVPDLVDLAERLLGNSNAHYDLAVHRYDHTAARYADLFADPR